jgi:hypothetical protein
VADTFWAAAGGAAVGALLGFVFSGLLEAAKKHGERLMALQVLQKDIEVSTRDLTEWYKTEDAPQVASNVHGRLRTLPQVRARFEVAPAWFAAAMADESTLEAVLDFYAGLRGLLDVAALWLQQKENSREWAETAYENTNRLARATLEAAEKATQSVAALRGRLGVLDWLRDLL